jgi:hypothetical protein
METIIGLALLFALAMAAYAASRIIVGGTSWQRPERRVERPAFPAVMSRQTHWSRATSVVELSLSRAADMAAHQANAARQLEAADYALHVLLGELNQVMATTVMSPLTRKARPAAASVHMPAALAA